MDDFWAYQLALAYDTPPDVLRTCSQCGKTSVMMKTTQKTAYRCNTCGKKWSPRAESIFIYSKLSREEWIRVYDLYKRMNNPGKKEIQATLNNRQISINNVEKIKEVMAWVI